MAMSLLGLAIGEPRRGLPDSFGKLCTSMARSFACPSGLKAPASMSLTTPDKSRIAPLPSRMPGFSLPASPYRTSLILPSSSCSRSSPRRAWLLKKRNRDCRLQRYAAVDDDGVPGHEYRVVGAQIDAQIGDLFGV